MELYCVCLQSIELPSLVCTCVCSVVLAEGVSLLFPVDEYMQLSVEVRKSKKDSAHSGESPPPPSSTVLFYDHSVNRILTLNF